jgi:hypothetical protein
MLIRVTARACVLMLGASAGSAGAQAIDCGTVPLEARDACVVSHDIHAYLTPQLGLALSGGNHVLGQGGSLGGFGRLTLGLRANVIGGNFPSVQPLSTTGPSIRSGSNPYPTINQHVVVPAIELAFGLFRGFKVGSRTFGGVDVLGGAVYVPELDLVSGSSTLSVASGSGLAPAYGARVGLLLESLYVPGVSVSYMKRRMPTVDLVASVADDSLRLEDMSISSSGWRLTVGKSLAALSLAAGFGTDEYDNEAAIEAIVNGTSRAVAGPGSIALTMSRTNYFANASLHLPFLRLIAEGGIVRGGGVPTVNVFDVDPNVSRVYGSVGIQVSR